MPSCLGYLRCNLSSLPLEGLRGAGNILMNYNLHLVPAIYLALPSLLLKVRVASSPCQPLSLTHLYFRSLNELIVYDDNTIKTPWHCQHERRRKGSSQRGLWETALLLKDTLVLKDAEHTAESGHDLSCFPAWLHSCVAAINSVEEGSSDISQCDLTSQVQSRVCFLV